MKSSDDLFRLVKSLTSAEKGYFKKYTAKHVIGEKNDYIILFTALDKMDVWDEDVLKRRLSKSGFLHRVSSVKNYLNKLLLESLRAFYGESTIERELLEMLSDISFLWRRGLRTQAGKLILRAKSLAYQYEEWELTLKILNWQFVTIEAAALTAPARQRLQEITKEKLKILEYISNAEQYRDLHDAISILNSREGMSGGEPTVELAKILAHPLLQSEETALAHSSKLNFYSILVIAENMYGNDISLALKYARRRYQIMQERPDLIAEKPMVYIRGVQMYVQRCILAGLFDETEKTLAAFEQMIAKLDSKLYEAARIEAFVMKTTMEVLYFLNSGKLDEGVQRIDVWQKGITLYRKQIGLQLYRPLCFNICVMLVFACKWEEALVWLNRSIEEQPDIRRDIVSAAKLLALIIHYELGNSSLLEYTVRSTYRYLAKRERLGKPEQIVLRFLKKVSGVISRRELIVHFIQLHKQLQELNASNDTTILDLFDFSIWLESKTTGKSLTELFLAKIASESESHRNSLP